MTPEYYISVQSPKQQTVLNNLLFIITSAAPAAKPKMSYGVICFFYHYMLVGISAKKHNCCSFYIMSPALANLLSEELKDVTYKGSTIHFPLDQSLPEKLITTVVRLRMKENEERLRIKENKSK